MEKIVYHGSRNGNIKELQARISTHRKECIYATENPAVALAFMSHGNGDLDLDLSYDNGVLTIVERRPGVLVKRFSNGGYLYELSGETFNHYDYLWSAEVISFEKSIKPNKVTYINNILEEIIKNQKEGKVILYTYPNRPLHIPLDNSDLIDKYIHFEEIGIKGAVNQLLEIYPEFEEIVEEKLNSQKTK